MEQHDNKLASDIERERREIADLQEKVKELVSRNEGPGREKRHDELEKLRHNIGAAESMTRAAP
jgi:hypothetical protein